MSDRDRIKEHLSAGSKVSLRQSLDIREIEARQRRGKDAVRLRQFSVDRASVSVFWIGPDARLYYVNDAACRSLGYSREELENMSVHDIDPTFPLDRWADHWRITKEREVITFESVHRTKDGRIFPVELVVNHLDLDGSEYHCVFAREITERKRAEEALRNSEARYRAVVEDQTELICRFNPDGIITFVNESYCRYFNKKILELIGSNYFYLFPEEDRQTVVNSITALSFENPVITYERRVINAHGDPIWQQWTDRAIIDEKGGIVEYQSVGRDITERKRMEKQLSKANERYHALIQSLPVGVMSVDTDDRITEWNPWAETITGYSEAESLGRSCAELLQCGDDKLNCPLKEAIKNRAPVGPVDHTFRNKRGKSVPVRVRAALLFDQTGQVMGGVETFQDISYIKALERERSNIMAMLVHDMKSPLIGIQGLATRLFEKYDDLPPESRGRYLQFITKEANKLEDLIVDILDFSPTRSGSLKLDFSPTDLHAELLDLTETLQPRFSQAGILLETGLAPDLPLIRADAPRLRRVFTNLLDNALRHSKPDTTVSVRAGVEEKEIRVQVKDQGSGIPPEDLPHIFEPFYRGHKRQGYQGHGLGLAGVKAIVRSHGGRVYVSSCLGDGAAFTVALPGALILDDG